MDTLSALQQYLTNRSQSPLSPRRPQYGGIIPEDGSVLQHPGLADQLQAIKERDAARERSVQGLPEAVQRSILQRPSYAEDQAIPSQQPSWADYESFEPDFGQGLLDPRARERLGQELRFSQQEVPQLGQSIPEGATISRTMMSPYSGPYNLGFGYPFALY